MQKTIYIKDEVQWERIKEIAGSKKLSVSRLIQEAIEGLVGGSQLDRIEKKLDELIWLVGKYGTGKQQTIGCLLKC